MNMMVQIRSVSTNTCRSGLVPGANERGCGDGGDGEAVSIVDLPTVRVAHDYTVRRSLSGPKIGPMLCLGARSGVRTLECSKKVNDQKG